MIDVDWKDFLTENRISWIDDGANTKKGEISVCCPWCGRGDEGYHLGINLNGKGFGCWRDRKHRGKSPVRLVAALLGISTAKALSLLDTGRQATKDQFVAMLDGLVADKPKTKPLAKGTLSFPRNTYQINSGEHVARFVQYLDEKRGFDGDGVRVAKRYGLRCAITGSWSGRLIVPVVCKGLVNWTGRSLSKASKLRYKSLGEEQGNWDEPACLRTTDKCLLFYDDIIADETVQILIVAEGPLDAMKLDYYGSPYGVRATCLFTASMSKAQRGLLHRLPKRIKRICVMLDQGFYETGCELASGLLLPHASAVAVPMGYKDAGEMPPSKVTKFAKRLINDLHHQQ